MKKFGMIVGLLFLIATSAHAESKWRLQLGLGTSLLVSNFNPIYNIGIGLAIGVGYVINENWSIWGVSNGYFLPADTPGSTMIINEGVLSGHYTIHAQGMNPYLLLGLGTFTQIASNTYFTVSTSDFMLQGGVGLEFPAGDGLDFFVETKGNLILATGTTAVDIPINAGVNLAL